MRFVNTQPRRSSTADIELLNSLDNVFLAVESVSNPMNIGSVGIFEGPMPPAHELHELVASRTSIIRRCRQRIHRPLGSWGRPMWIDDVHFDPRHHVDIVARAEGAGAGLCDMVADFVAEPLDRHHPLWRIRIVDGLDDGRWAVVAKVHHCMVDGIAGSDLLSTIMTPTPETQPGVPDSALPLSEPSRGTLIWLTTRAALGSLGIRIRGALHILRHPVRAWRSVRDVVTAGRGLWFRRPHPPTCLVGPIGTTRRWARFVVPLDQIRMIQENLEGTVNDVVVTAVASGLHDLLLNRGETTSNRIVTAMVPVSLRPQSERGSVGNRVANVHAQIPVEIDDLRSFAREVHEHLDQLKSSHQVDATGLVMHLGRYVPTVAADRIARAIFHRQRTVETVVTNVPGPPAPLFFGAYEMVAAYPVPPIGGLVRTTIAIWSYCDMLSFGITCDRDAITDADLASLASGIERGFTEMVRLASEQ